MISLAKPRGTQHRKANEREQTMSDITSQTSRERIADNKKSRRASIEEQIRAKNRG